MKTLKILFIIAVISTLGSASAQTKMNAKDSASYAIGMDMARMIQSFDSTMNIDLIIRGLQDKFSNTEVFGEDQAQLAIMRYVQHKEALQNSAREDQINKTLEESAKFLASVETQEGVMKTQSGLLYKIEKLGEGRLAQDGDMITVHYTMKLPNGEILDSSYDRGEPLTYENVEGQMIVGFKEGVQLLGEGGKATLYLPSSLAYGRYGMGEIPPGQVLIFEVNVLGVTKKPRKR